MMPVSAAPALPCPRDQHQLARGDRLVYDDTYTLDLTWTTN
jgi:hypothetical protein